MRNYLFPVLALIAITGGLAPGQVTSPVGRYALILSDPSVLAMTRQARGVGATAEAVARNRVESAQALVRNELAARRIRVTWSVSNVLNAVFVAAPASRLADLQSIPGIVGVVPLHRRKMLLNDATALLNGVQAWTITGGLNNAGAGIKIGILDTGIDQTHPMLQDTSLAIPAGFPRCDVQSNCDNFTNNKVIVARSYVAMVGAGFGSNPAANSQPDDYSARDRVGHGTAVATAAAGNTATGSVTINGMAPKAWIGNYKIAGSPDVNDGTYDDAFIAALDDAVKDGMDVITTSFGGTATTGPLDTGSACGQAPNTPCDPLAQAFENAAEAGHIIIAAAGNEGNGGNYGTSKYPTYNTMGTPADAPAVIAVGAASNTHSFNPGVIVSGSNVPANLNLINAGWTDAYSPYGAYSGPLIDLTAIGQSEDLGCNALPAFSLNGAIALIERGTCTFATKMTNAVNAGAIGAIFWDNVNEPLAQFDPGGLSSFTQQVLAIANSDGQNLKTFIDSNPGFTVTMDPAAVEVPLTGSPVLADYSSFGPGLGTSGIKPDVLGIGGGSENGDLIYMGAQNFDPLGAAYSSTRYIAAAGTSFATPLIAGVSALVRQQHPGYSGQQVKSAIVNTASQSITTDDFGDAVNILQTGSGLAAADAALNANVTIVPATLSFGSFKSGATVSQTQTVALTNTGKTSVTAALSVRPAVSASGASVAVNPASVALAPGATQNVTVSLTGSIPAGGVYYGNINLAGASVPLHAPYLFIVPTGSSTGANLNATIGDGDIAVAGQQIPDGSVGFQVTDANGAPLTGAPVTFTQGQGSVPLTLSNVSSTTDNYGYAYADVTIGSQTGNYDVHATAAGQVYDFSGTVIAAPTISMQNGIVGVINAAAANAGAPIAPGSYVSLYGSNFATSNAEFYTPNYLPLSLNNITVSFDAPATGSLPAISVPGYLSYVSSTQVNVFVPWELQGYSSVQVKVTANEYGYGPVVTVPVSNYAPAFFETSSGNAAALDSKYQVITPTHPAVRGQNISLYVNGLGPVNHQPGSGFAASTTSITQTTTQKPQVTIGGQSAQVSYSGLAPGFVGLYQVNATVPANISAGNQPLVISIGGATSKASGITVQ
jgi:minor extracellular serine protease Vpr